MSASITLNSRFEHINEYIQKNLIDNNSYVYSGRPYPWKDEAYPDVVRSDVKSDTDTRLAMIYLMKLSQDNVCKAIKRFDWLTGFIYTQADHDKEYSDIRRWLHPESPFYVINSEGNVYKCVSNNYSTISTDEPTGQNPDITYTADGYMWKFMFDISSDVEDMFLSDNWIPVPEGDRKTDVQENIESVAVDGSISFIRVDNEGKDYTGTPVIIIKGDGSGCEATAITSSGKIVEITVTDIGSGYTYADIEIYGAGYEAVATAMISPKGGHGADAVTELGAFYLSFSLELRGDSDGYPAVSTYRNVGLIRNPLKIDSEPIIEDNITTLNTINIEFASGDFIPNEKVIGEDSQAYGSVYYDEVGDDTNVILYNVHGTFIEGEKIHGQESEVNATFHVSGTEYNEVDLVEGQLLYRENIKFIARNSLQTEKMIFVIEF